MLSVYEAMLCYIAIDPKEDSVSLDVDKLISMFAVQLHSNRSERGFCKIFSWTQPEAVSQLHSNRSERGFCKKYLVLSCLDALESYIAIDPKEDSVRWVLRCWRSTNVQLHSNRSERGFVRICQLGYAARCLRSYIAIDPKEDSVSQHRNANDLADEKLHSNRSERGFCKTTSRLLESNAQQLHSNRSERGFCKNQSLEH